MHSNRKYQHSSRIFTCYGHYEHRMNSDRYESSESPGRSQRIYPERTESDESRGKSNNFMRYGHSVERMNPRHYKSSKSRDRTTERMIPRHYKSSNSRDRTTERMIPRHYKSSKSCDRTTNVIDYKSHDLNYNNTYNYSPLFLAVHNGNLEVANSLLKKEASVHKELFGKSLIHVAAARGHEQMICLLCIRNAKVDKKDKDGNTPLHLSVKGDHTDVVSLLTNETTANLKNHSEETPLHIATANDLLHLVKILVKNGARVDEQDANGRYPIHIAVMKPNPNITIITFLLSHGNTVNSICHKGLTPLHHAVDSKNLNVIEVLLNHGASINISNHNGKSPLLLAAEKNMMRVVKKLLSKGSNTDLGITNEMTPLHFAAKYGNLEIVQLLITKGYDAVNAKVDGFNPPLYFAVTNGNLQVIKYLIEYGADIDTVTSVGETLIHISAINGHVDVFKYLIECGIDVNKKTDDGETVLHLSAAAEHLDFVNEILNHNVNIDSVNNKEYTALALAVKGRKKKVVSLLLSKGAKIEINGFTCLHIASKNGDEEILKILLEKGAKVDYESKNNKTALHYAATFGHRKSLEILVKSGANINSETLFKETPLHLAAASGRPESVRYLLDAGAEVDKVTVKGYTPLLYVLDKERHAARINLRIRNFPPMARSVRNLSNVEYTVSPFMFDKYLKITEMLLIKGASLLDINIEGNNPFDFASQIRVSADHPFTKDANKGEFRPEIVICMLNYINGNDSFIVNLLLLDKANLNNSKLLDLLLEYNTLYYENTLNYDKLYKMIELVSNHKSIIAVIDHIKEIRIIVSILEAHFFPKNIKILVAALVKIRSTLNGKSVPESREINILNLYDLHKWYTQCELEIMNMRVTKIHPQFDMTFYDIITKPVNKIATYVRNKDLFRILESDCYKRRFPAYIELLKRSVEKGNTRRKLIDSSIDSLFNIIQQYHKISLPVGVIDKIIGHLSVIELRKLSAVVL